MKTSSSSRSAVFIALMGGSVLGATGLSAQAPTRIDFPYEECALRIKSSFFGQDLARGADDEKADGLGFPMNGLTAAFAGSPAAQELAASYRRRSNTGRVVGMVGSGLLLAAFWRYDNDSVGFGTDDTAAWLFLGGSFLTITGVVIEASGRDRLSRAIWEYNAALAR